MVPFAPSFAEVWDALEVAIGFEACMADGATEEEAAGAAEEGVAFLDGFGFAACGSAAAGGGGPSEMASDGGG